MPEVLAGKSRYTSGQRSCWVEIYEMPVAPEGGDFPVEEWTALEGAWMNRLDRRADERFAANQDTAYVETQWQMPYRANMDPEIVDVPARRRLRYRGRIYNIQAALLMERRKGIELITVANVG